jgi:hypothetical protein
MPVLNMNKKTHGRRPLPPRITPELLSYDLATLTARLQAQSSPLAEALLKTCQAEVASARCTPCAQRKAAAKIRLFLSSQTAP